MSEKVCISCFQNAQQNLYCTNCEQEGFIKSGLFVFFILLSLLGANEKNLTSDQPGVYATLIIISAAVSYYLRKVVSATMFRVVIPTIFIILIIEGGFLLEAKFFAYKSCILWHITFLSNLPFFTLLVLLMTLRPVIFNGLSVGQLEYVEGKEKSAIKQTHEEEDDTGHDDLLGL